MKVVHVIHGLQIGGIAALVYDLTRASTALDQDITVIAMRRDPDPEVLVRFNAYGQNPHLNLITLDKRKGKGRLKASADLRKALKKIKPDVLVVHHEHLFPMVLAAAQGIPAIQVIHNQKLDASFWMKTIGKRFFRHFVFVSEAARHHALDAWTLNPEMTLTIPNGLDLSGFTPSPTLQKRFLFVGRLTAQKNLGGLIQRYSAYAAQTKSPWPLTIVGSGEDEPTLRNLIKTNQLEKLVTLTKAQGSIAKVYRSHGCLLLPSHYEGTPMVILEAMASGLVVIANAVGGVGAMIRHGVDGFAVDPLKADDFVQAMCRISQDEPLWIQMAQAARVSSQQSDITVTAKAYDTLLRSIVKGSHD